MCCQREQVAQELEEAQSVAENARQEASQLRDDLAKRAAEQERLRKEIEGYKYWNVHYFH